MFAVFNWRCVVEGVAKHSKGKQQMLYEFTLIFESAVLVLSCVMVLLCELYPEQRYFLSILSKVCDNHGHVFFYSADLFTLF